MNVAVLGLWHLGSVTAACIAAAGHSVKAFDPDPPLLRRSQRGAAAGRGAGLSEVIARGAAVRHAWNSQRPSNRGQERGSRLGGVRHTVDEEDRPDVDLSRSRCGPCFPIW